MGGRCDRNRESRIVRGEIAFPEVLDDVGEQEAHAHAQVAERCDRDGPLPMPVQEQRQAGGVKRQKSERGWLGPTRLRAGTVTSSDPPPRRAVPQFWMQTSGEATRWSTSVRMMQS